MKHKVKLVSTEPFEDGTRLIPGWFILELEGYVGGGWNKFVPPLRYRQWLEENCRGQFRPPTTKRRSQGKCGLRECITDRPFEFELLEDATLFRLKFK